MNLICFDLEGPLTPQDNAYQLMQLFPQGGRIFEIISRYDDLLTLEGRSGYEPGDTLALIVPFLAYHGVEEGQIATMGQKARLTPGAPELISELKSRGWQIFCISTSYEQYAFPITRRLGIPDENVACTSFPLARIRRLLGREEFALLAQTENEIAEFRPFADDVKIKEYLDHFYWQKLSQTKCRRAISEVKPVGGERKVRALEQFSVRVGEPFSGWVVVGDSITDFKMLHAVNKAGGLAVAFNANEYVLPYATIGLASANLYDLCAALEAWTEGKRQRVEAAIKEREKAGGSGDAGYFHWLDRRSNIASALDAHKRFRHLVRKEAADLG